MKIIEIQEKLKYDTLGLALSFLRLANVQIQLDRNSESEKNFKRSAELFKAINHLRGMDMVYNNLGVLYGTDNPKKALEFYRHSLEVRKTIPDYDFWVAYSYFNMGNVFLRLDEPDSARFYLYRAKQTFEEDAKREVPAMVLAGLGEYHFVARDYEQAESFARQALTRARERNHTEIIIEATELLANCLEKQGEFELAYEQLKAYQELQNTYDSLNNAGRIAELELNYKTAKQQKEIAQLEADNALQESELQQSRWLLTSILLGAGLLSVIGISLFLRRRQQQKLHTSKLEAGLSEVKLIALRAQMNPHFIFNCINTAQNFVINAEKESAYEYLASFARLLRMVLENSQKTFIPLEDELEQLQLYLELELIRFDEKFNYEIEMGDNLEEENLEIPSMILQPFVENAILHGLVNRSDPKGGLLKIKLHRQKDMIECVIEDNGVGRDEAQVIKREKAVHYQSAALPNIEERLQILSKVMGASIHYRIEDLNESGSQGTRVVLHLPTR